MATSNVIGLLLQINADPSKADAAVQGFAQRTGQSVGMVQAQIKDYNRAATSAYDEAVQRTKAVSGVIDEELLSNRESVRLMSEEFGVHLPRAISGAISKIEGLQSVMALAGTAALGIFAAEALFKGIEKVTEYVHDSFIHQTEDAKAFAAAAVAAYKQTENAAESAFTKFKTVEAGAFHIADIDAHVKDLEKIVDAYKRLDQAAAHYQRFHDPESFAVLHEVRYAESQDIWNLEDAYKRLAQAGQLQFDARQHMVEVEAKDEQGRTKQHEEAAREWVRTEKEKEEESTRAARLAAENAHKSLEVESRLRREQIKAGQEAGKVMAELAQHQRDMAASAVQADRDELKFVMDLERFGIVEQKNLSFLKEYTPNMYTAAAATQHLGRRANGWRESLRT